MFRGQGLPGARSRAAVKICFAPGGGTRRKEVGLSLGYTEQWLAEGQAGREGEGLSASAGTCLLAILLLFQVHSSPAPLLCGSSWVCHREHGLHWTNRSLGTALIRVWEDMFPGLHGEWTFLRQSTGKLGAACGVFCKKEAYFPSPGSCGVVPCVITARCGKSGWESASPSPRPPCPAPD